MCCSLKDIYNYVFQKKRLLLLFLLLIIPPFIFKEYLYNFYYFTPVLIIISFSLFWNFPQIATLMHTRPLYFSDLEVTIEQKNIFKTEEAFNIAKQKYKFIFMICLSIVTSILIGALFDIWLIKTKNTNDLPEIIGITGGMLSMYGKFQNYFGKFLLYILFRVKEKNNILTNNNDPSPTKIVNHINILLDKSNTSSKAIQTDNKEIVLLEIIDNSIKNNSIDNSIDNSIKNNSICTNPYIS